MPHGTTVEALDSGIGVVGKYRLFGVYTEQVLRGVVLVVSGGVLRVVGVGVVFTRLVVGLVKV